MFTGIVEEIGTVKYISIKSHSGTITIQSKVVLEGTVIGDSIAVNGVCLTVTDIGKNDFKADVMAETYRKSALFTLKAGSHVNLERAMPLNGRFGGHIVSGHIDGTGKIIQILKEENAIWYTVKADQNILRYVVLKGSIAIDGISLTVAFVDKNTFKISMIPHTQSKTILQYKNTGDYVNLECDLVGKYIEKLIQNREMDSYNQQDKNNTTSGFSREFLEKNGF